MYWSWNVWGFSWSRAFSEEPEAYNYSMVYKDRYEENLGTYTLRESSEYKTESADYRKICENELE